MPITQSPFRDATGPQVTPKTMNSAGAGGQMNPNYLQMRTPTMANASAGPMSPPPAYPQQQTQPTVTPPGGFGGLINKLSRGTPSPSGPQVSPPPTAPAGPPQAGGNSLGGVYNFFKSDLENQAKQAEAGAKADASARGVYYGTPLTGSEADIHTQFLRGLGQLQAGMYGNEQQNQLARLGLASNLSWQNAMNQPPSPGPMDWSSLGAIFGNSPSVSGQRGGPTQQYYPDGTPRNGPQITPPPKSPNQTGDNPNPAQRGY